MKHTVSEEALHLVETRVKELGGTMTPQDGAAATGLTVSEAQDALERMMELYVTRVRVDDDGRILFDFDLPLRQRGKKTVAERWASVRDALWNGFKVGYKVFISLMLIVFFVVMVVLALMIARGSSDDDDGPSGSLLGGLFRMIGEGLQFAFWTRAFGGGFATDSHGYRYRTADVPRGFRKSKDKKSFVIAIYDFALGPERPDVDPLENEKEAAAFLQEEKGVLTASEVIALSGGDFDTAEERLADYIARFDGYPNLTDDGVVVGEFESFVEGGSTEVTGDIVPFWEEYEAPYQLTGNDSGRNFFIGFMALFICVVGLWLGPGGQLDTLSFQYQISFFSSQAATVLLSVIPVAFGASFLLLPLLRWPVIQRKEKQRLTRNRKKQVMRSIFLRADWSCTVEQVYNALPSKTREELSGEDVGEILGQLVHDLQGDIDLLPDGRAIYRFERLEREHAAAATARRRLGESTGS